MSAATAIDVEHELVNRAGIAVRPLADGPPRSILAAYSADCPPPTRALVALLRELGAPQRSRSVLPPSTTSDAPVT